MTTSARSSTLAACGGGSKVWLLVPSGITPTRSALSPMTLAAIDVMGATVLTTTRRAAPDDEEPVDGAAAGASSEDPHATVKASGSRTARTRNRG